MERHTSARECGHQRPWQCEPLPLKSSSRRCARSGCFLGGGCLGCRLGKCDPFSVVSRSAPPASLASAAPPPRAPPLAHPCGGGGLVGGIRAAALVLSWPAARVASASPVRPLRFRRGLPTDMARRPGPCARGDERGSLPPPSNPASLSLCRLDASFALATQLQVCANRGRSQDVVRS